MVKPTPHEPMNLDAIEGTGAVRHGRPVVKVAVYYADADEPSVLIMPARAEPDEVNTEDRIMGALKKAKKPMGRKEVARQLHFTSARGRFGEAFRALVSEGKILRRGEEYTDDASKFGELT